MKRFSKVISMVLASFMVLSMTACSSSKENSKAENTAEDAPAPVEEKAEEPVELVVFAAASMTETMNKIAEIYKEVAPNVTLTYNFDSSGTLKTQIEEGADCDIFISAAQKQMNALDASSDKEANPDGLDFVLPETRFNIVSNSVVLIAPKGNPAQVASFDDVNTEKVSLIALGNADVPVGQYSEQIFTTMGVWENLKASSKITFGTNVKEVLSQVAQAAVDCGVVYSTDAATTADVEVIASAPEGSHKPITYPAAIMNVSKNQDAAKAFLEFLKTAQCKEVFEGAGFVIPA